MEIIKYCGRLTTSFLQAIPDNIKQYDAYLYAIVKRKPSSIIYNNPYGLDVRLDPCVLDWKTKTITIYIPTNINVGIKSIDDLDPSFFESVEVAFLSLLQNSL